MVLLDIAEVLHLWPDQTEYIMHLNDRPEICLIVWTLTFTAKSFQDLNFLIPDNFEEGDPPPDKFLIFFDDHKEAERACKYLRAQFPQSLWDKIRWFHSVITDKTRQDDVEAMRKGETWGFCCTDLFGMVISLTTLNVHWTHQDSGYGPPRHKNCDTMEGNMWFVYFVAVVWLSSSWGWPRSNCNPLHWKKDTNEEQVLKAGCAAQRLAKKNEAMTGKKRKAGTQLISGTSKRQTLGECTNVHERTSHSLGTPLSHEAVPTELREQRHAHYKKWPLAKVTTAKEKKTVNVEVGSPMDDFINVASDHDDLIDCHCIVPMLFFENDKRCT